MGFIVRSRTRCCYQVDELLGDESQERYGNEKKIVIYYKLYTAIQYLFANTYIMVLYYSLDCL